MKVVYNWLKDFVDVTAPPHELASRLALSGSNVAGIENGPHGAVIDAEVGSNRPDCLGHLGLAREVAAIYKLALKPVSPKPKESSAKTSEAVQPEDSFGTGRASALKLGGRRRLGVGHRETPRLGRGQIHEPVPATEKHRLRT